MFWHHQAKTSVDQLGLRKSINYPNIRINSSASRVSVRSYEVMPSELSNIGLKRHINSFGIGSKPHKQISY